MAYFSLFIKSTIKQLQSIGGCYEFSLCHALQISILNKSPKSFAIFFKFLSLLPKKGKENLDSK